MCPVINPKPSSITPSSSIGTTTSKPSLFPSSKSSAPQPGAMCTTPVPSSEETSSHATTLWSISFCFSISGKHVSYFKPTNFSPLKLSTTSILSSPKIFKAFLSIIKNLSSDFTFTLT